MNNLHLPPGLRKKFTFDHEFHENNHTNQNRDDITGTTPGSHAHSIDLNIGIVPNPTNNVTNNYNYNQSTNNYNYNQSNQKPFGQVVASGRGRFVFSLPADGITDWALITRDKKPDRITSIGEEDRIGVLGAKLVRLSGVEGRIKIRDHRRVVGIIRDHDISLAEAQVMTFALPDGWPL